MIGRTPAMAAGARRATRYGAEGDEEGDGGDGVHDSDERYDYASHAEPQPQGFNIVPCFSPPR